MPMHCSSEEKAVWKLIYFQLPQKVTEHGIGMLLGNYVLFPGTEANLPQCFDFLLPSTCGNTQQFADIQGLQRTERDRRDRKFKGHYQDSVPCSTAERTATLARARQRQTLGKILPQCTSKQEVNSSYHLEVMVAIGGFHPSHPNNESPTTNILQHMQITMPTEEQLPQQSELQKLLLLWEVRKSGVLQENSTDTNAVAHLVPVVTVADISVRPVTWASVLVPVSLFALNTSLFKDLDITDLHKIVPVLRGGGGEVRVESIHQQDKGKCPWAHSLRVVSTRI